MTKTKYKFDLEVRTTKVSEKMIFFIKEIPQDISNKLLLNQLIRSATSIGANYCEANGAGSKRDFRNKIYTCKKEAKETKYWLNLIARANPRYQEKSKILWQEVQELTLIFSKIILTLENKEKK